MKRILCENHSLQSLILILSVFAPSLHASGTQSSTTLQSASFAKSQSPDTRVSGALHLRSEPQISLEERALDLPLREVRLQGFFEAGETGDFSFDPDPVVGRFPLSSKSSDVRAHAWLGRTLPVQEGSAYSGDAAPVLPTGAIGSNWVQNQSDALHPRVSGWIGAGGALAIPSTGLSASLAYSPVFLPSFGPRLDFSEVTGTSGSRFARIPPSYVRVGDALVPLYYQVNAGSVWNIVRQDQAFASVGHSSTLADFTAMAWTAPSPSPSIDANGSLHVKREDLRVKVDVRPSFSRENFLGARAVLKEILSKPEFETSYETGSHRWTVSSAFHPFGFLDFGVLHSFQRESVSATGFVTPRFADRLTWARIHSSPLSPEWEGALRWEKQWTKGREGAWFEPSVSYRPSFWKAATLFVNASVLAGKDSSYYGEWRTLDSVGMGMQVLW